MQLEICTGSYQDVVNAYHGGARRVELNSALYLGGLTPSLGSLILSKELKDLKVICMVRSRGGGFTYSKEEYDQMFMDAKILLEHGADGIAFGFLNSDHSIQIEKTKEMVALIHHYHKEAIFHRAIDVSDDLERNARMLVDCGIDRLLTSGGQAKALDGLATIKSLLHYPIEILAGSGINATNVQAFKDAGITQVHASCRAFGKDPTTAFANVSFAYGEEDYEYVSEEKVRALRRAIDE